MAANEEAFWAAIAAAPDDDLPKLMFADWLDDRGDSRGACLRWVVAEKKQPAYDKLDTKTWDWWAQVPADPVHHYAISPRQYVIPFNLFTRLQPFGPGIWKNRPTFDDALRELCSAWRESVFDGADPCGGDRPRPERKASVET
jgi:uncharacterized protein (TIGR02996 family)